MRHNYVGRKGDGVIQYIHILHQRGPDSPEAKAYKAANASNPELCARLQELDDRFRDKEFLKLFKKPEETVQKPIKPVRHRKEVASS